MNGGLTNIAAAQSVIAALQDAGVTEFCVCAGSRNSPLLAVLSASPFRLFSFVDERAAAFFALGRIKLRGQPVAVVTTSGTAVAELLPAAIEAHYAALPLVLVTADRPARYRGTGAPQAVEQVGLFGVYAETSLESWSAARPLHLNVEFDEPLIDAPVSALDLHVGQTLLSVAPLQPAANRTSPTKTFANIVFKNPLVIIGGLDERYREQVKHFAQQLNAPVFAEPLSGLREEADLPLITAGERMLRRGNFDGVIRIGNIPTLRFWRDLDESLRDLPLISFSALPFTGLSRGEVHPLAALPVDITPRDRDVAFFDEDRAQAARFEAILDDEPDSELAMFRKLSRDLPQGARIYLGNSLPIREWDLAATREPRGFTYEANRGANGIDGQLSTFFGQCDPARENVCVLGDLTTIYDLNAPWIVPQLDEQLRFRIVVMNNGGGRIFSRVASLRGVDPAARERIIENVHQIHFGHWAAMWGLEDFVTELLPDVDASARAWSRYDALWA
jgi:2-succinyl-5-enolpyruvyl-6-hydroxy-3-cyclohexene-1-carboxylate synthase